MVSKRNTKQFRFVSVLILAVLTINLSILLNSSDQSTTNIPAQIFEETNTNTPRQTSAFLSEEDLLAQYTFEDPYILGKDDSGNGHTGTVEYSTQVHDAERGNVINYYAQNSRILLGNVIDLPDNYTISVWFKNISIFAGRWNMLTTSQYGGAINQEDRLGGNGAYLLGVYVNYTVAADWYPASPSPGHSTSELYLNNYQNGWHHFAITASYDGTYARTNFYMDGELIGYALNRTNTDIWGIGNGARSGAAYRFAHYLDDFRVYGRNMSATEITQLYSETNEIPWYKGESGNDNYQYRIRMETEDNMMTSETTSLVQGVNFTDQFGNMRLSGSVDPSTIKMAEYYANNQSYDEVSDMNKVAGTNGLYNITWTKTNSEYVIPNATPCEGYVTDWNLLNTYNTYGPAEYDGSEYYEVDYSKFYNPGEATGLNASGNRYYPRKWFATYSDQPQINLKTEFNSIENAATYGFSQAYVYFPETVYDCYAWVTITRGDQGYHALWFDGIFPLTGAALTYPLPNTALTVIWYNSTHMVYRYKIGASSNPIVAGWHSFLLRHGNSNATDYTHFDFSMKLVNSGNPAAETPVVTGLKTSNYRPSESRVYYIYYNATSAVSQDLDYNFYGDLDTLNDTSEYVKNTYANVFPAEYNGYAQNLTLVGNAPWWNAEWGYRISMNVSSPTWNYYYNDHLVNQWIDFTELFASMGASTNFDEKSIRVLEYDEYFGIYTEIPCQFEKDALFIAGSNAIGTLSWVVAGKTTNSRDRFYFIYFDNLEYGSKIAADYSSMSNLMVTKNNNYDNDVYTVENDKIRISLCEGDPPGATSTYDQVYEVVDKRTGKTLTSSTPKGWDITYWNYGSTTITTDFNAMTSLVVVSEGPVKVTLKMSFETTNFIYDRYYTMNYLDDTITMTHSIQAKSSIGAGYWRITSDWNPVTDVDSAIGLGGYNFQVNANRTIDGSSEYTSSDNLPAISIGGTSQFSKYMSNAWYSTWNEAESYGVGTVWNKGAYNSRTTPWSTYITQIDMGIGGLLNVYYLTVQGVTAGYNLNYTITGQVFNGYTGQITKVRANGLQTPMSRNVGTVQKDPYGKLSINLRDNENQVINNATVKIFLPGDLNVQYKVSDALGNVSIKGLTSATWSVDIFYLVNNQINYTIYHTDSLLINTNTEQKYYQTYSCNLTTLTLTVVDYEVTDPLYNKLYLANVTMYNSTTGVKIATMFSDSFGSIVIKIPLTTWNFTVRYLGVEKPFNISNGGAVLKTMQQIVISGVTNEIFNVSTSASKTDLKIVTVSASNWAYTYNSAQVPTLASVYCGDTLTMIYNYTRISPTFMNLTVGVLDSDVFGTWILSRKSTGAVIVGGDINTDFQLLMADSGIYEFSLDSSSILAGLYVLTVEIFYDDNTADIYQNFTLKMEIELLNFTTQIDLVSPAISPIIVTWNSTLSVSVQYSANYPEIRLLDVATLKYLIVGTSITGDLTGGVNGIYSFTRQELQIATGSYILKIFGTQENYMYAETTITLVVEASPTQFNLVISNEYKVSSIYLKGASGENITFQVNFTSPLGEHLEGAIIAAYFKDIPENTLNFVYYKDGLYNCSINVNEYAAGTYRIKIQAYKEFYKAQETEIDVEFVDYWNTEITIIDPPQFYSWGDNASFIIMYESVDVPRTNWILDNAEITQLNVTYKIEKTEYNQICLTENTRNVLWGWFNLGGGYYQVWFNTSVINLTNTMAFYAIPSINMTVFREATERPYVWIAPAGTSLTATTPKVARDSLEIVRLKLDQSAVITVHYNVTGVCSLNSLDVSNAYVTYQIDGGVKTQLTQLGAGRYSFTLNAITLGEFKITMTAVLENYTTSIAEFTFYCDRKPISYAFSGKIQASQQSIITPQNIKINFTLELNDTVAGGVLSDATIKVVFNNVEYLFYEDAPNTGRYTIIIGETILSPLELETAYTLTIYVMKTNYTVDTNSENGIELFPIEIAVTLTLPVDPFIGIPYMYWQIIAITIAIMIGIYATSVAVKNARIPMIIKIMQRTEKIINGKKTMPEGRVTKTMEEDLVDKYSKDWQLIDLNLRNILGLDKKPGDFSTPTDKQEGGQ